MNKNRQGIIVVPQVRNKKTEDVTSRYKKMKEYFDKGIGLM